ncbi:MAG: glycoside hydrolase/phage tail family protein [Hyphomicrobiales bacterium]
MATVVLQYAGQALGAVLGGPLGAVVGRAAGAVAGNFIDQKLFGTTRRVTGPRLSDLRVMSSSEGADMPRLWGRMRVSGQVIWATQFEEVKSTSTEKASAKGGGSGTRVTEYLYYANFAVALCEGEIDRIGRVWADGKSFDLSELTYRVHPGSETQEPDSLIVAKEGADNAPAYRGTAYVVFERMPLADFGNRLPQLSFEVIRGAGGLSSAVTAVNIIPGSTEFGYDTEIVTRRTGPGQTESDNAHASALRSDWSVSVDDLTATCRNLEAAALVVAWFGTDLRCGTCSIRPGVEDASKQTDGETWSVASAGRATAHVVSRYDGAAAYGGTPSDASVVRAIQDLRARGLKPVFYPFVLMDIPEANGLADPHGAAEQGAYPWRGRITCSIAPGLAGSPDGTAACAEEVAGFVGTAAPSDFSVHGSSVAYDGPEEWSYRRMVLHYAHLCAAAGGVEAFLIGSELRGLTRLRDGDGGFPFVAALATLAAEVKAILPDAKISYAADWSEYGADQPADGSGDLHFPLDALWSSSAIDVIGIDNYMPLADWRDGDGHLDRLAGHDSPYDLAYLQSNIGGGEDFDWYYADEAARIAQLRSPIADAAHGKPWVFRCKDLVGWWSNPHYERRDGVELAEPTAWVPQSKPIWFTEAGCPAIDKGANQPNAFTDAKSSEDLRPYFSDGRRDDLMQYRTLAALLDHWSRPGDHNPVSAVTGAPMVAADRIFLWAWDARPYPWFPADSETWADGGNYARGHWLNGRLAAVPVDQLIAGVCAAYGMSDVDVNNVEGLVDGFLIDRAMSARDALEGLLTGLGIDVVESDGRLHFRMRRRAVALPVSVDALVEEEPTAPLFQVTRAQETELPAALRLSYIESGLDYRTAAVEARRLSGRSAGETSLALPAAIEQAVAQQTAEAALHDSWVGRERLSCGLGLRHAALEPGDILVTEQGSFRIEEIADGGWRKIRARSFDSSIYQPADAPPRAAAVVVVQVYGAPDALVMDLPIASDGADAHAPWLAASASPWPGTLAVYRGRGSDSYELNRTMTAPATKGRLIDPLAAGPLHVFDRANAFRVKLDSGALAALDESEVLDGGNIAAVGDAATGWEIVQFAGAELVDADTYRISTLLRGQSGSAPEMLASRAAGSRFVLLNAAVVQPELALQEAGLAVTWRIGPAAYDASRRHVSLTQSGKMLGLRPMAPCHSSLRRDGADLIISWTRRTRTDGDSWDLAEVPLGEDSESYVIEIRSGDTLKRSAASSQAWYRYAAADITADFGAMPESLGLRIAQVSASYGRGATLERILNV